MTSTSLGSMPAWAMASVAAFTISDSLVSPSSLPNLPWDQPTMQAVMELSFDTDRTLDAALRRVGAGSRYVYIHLYRLPGHARGSAVPKFRRPASIDCGLSREPTSIHGRKRAVA